MGNGCYKYENEEDGLALEERRKRTIRKMKELQRRRRELARRTAAAHRIQAWWRGTLVRRTLLAAALRAWVIQRWWRRLRWWRGHGLRRRLLRVYALEEQGAVTLQSWFRMRRCLRGSRGARGTLCLAGPPESCEAPRGPRDPPARRRGAAGDLEFRVELMTV